MHFTLHSTKPTSGVASHHGHFFSHSHGASDPGKASGTEEGEDERESVSQTQTQSQNHKGEGDIEPRVDSPLQENNDQDREQQEEEKERKEGEQEEISEWIEGKDIVIERKSCVPGEDVQVEVLRGAAGCEERERERMVREAKERMRRRGKEAEGRW